MLKLTNSPRRLVWLVLVAFLLNQTAFAAQPVRIPASPDGPSASLVLEGKSAYLLPHLKHQDGTSIKAEEMRKLTDEYYLIDPEAKPDKAGYWEIIRMENEAYATQSEPNPQGKPGAADTAGAQALKDAEKRNGELQNRLVEATNKNLNLQQQLDAANRTIATLQQQLAQKNDAGKDSKKDEKKAESGNANTGNSVNPFPIIGLVALLILALLFRALFKRLVSNKPATEAKPEPAGIAQSPLNLSANPAPKLRPEPVVFTSTSRQGRRLRTAGK